MNRLDKLMEMLLRTPEDCFLLHALGLEYLKMGEVQKAVDAFQRVLQSDAHYVGTYYHLAKSYERTGDLENALATYKKGIDVATLVKDNHAKNELRMALEDLEDV